MDLNVFEKPEQHITQHLIIMDSQMNHKARKVTRTLRESFQGTIFSTN